MSRANLMRTAFIGSQWVREDDSSDETAPATMLLDTCSDVMLLPFTITLKKVSEHERYRTDSKCKYTENFS